MSKDKEFDGLENNVKEGFRQALHQMMQAKGLRASEIARKGGLSKDALSSYTTGRSIPNQKNLRKLAKALGCNPKELMTRSTVTKDTFAEVREHPTLAGVKMLYVKLPLRAADAHEMAQRAEKLSAEVLATLDA